MVKLCSPLSVCLYFHGLGDPAQRTGDPSPIPAPTPPIDHGFFNVNCYGKSGDFLNSTYFDEDGSYLNWTSNSNDNSSNNIDNINWNLRKIEDDFLSLDFDLDNRTASDQRQTSVRQTPDQRQTSVRQSSDQRQTSVRPASDQRERSFASARQCSGPLTSYDGLVLFWLEYVSICVLGSAFVLFGIFGNSLNLVILTRTRIGKVTSNILLIALAVTDMIVLITFFARYAACFTCYLGQASSTTVNSYLMIYGGIHSVAASFYSVNITAVIAVERAFSVFFPFRVSAIFNKKTIKAILLVLLVSPLGVVIPFLILTRVTWSVDPRSNATVANGYSFRGNHQSFLYALGWIESINLIVAMALVLVCGSSTVIKLKRRARIRRLKMKSSTGTSAASMNKTTQEQKAVKMLLIVALVSFISNIPNILVNVLFSFELEYLVKVGLFCYIQAIANLFVVVNSSINFLIYFVMSQKFKHACSDILRNVRIFQRLCPYKKEQEEDSRGQ